MAEAILTAAMAYHRLGWSIIPMKMGEKKPAVPWKRYQSTRPNEKSIKQWFGSDSAYGIAVIFGSVSGGLVSRDFDSMESYERWKLAYPQLASSLPTVETARGRHVYCLAEEQHVLEVRSRLGKPPGTGAIMLPDGELRAGVGCYSVVPPSQHPSGATYRWLNPADSLRMMDLENGGLAGLPGDTERTEKTEDNGGKQRTTEAIGGEEGVQFGELPWDSNIKQSLHETLPTGRGMRNDRVFELARTLKAIPELSGMAGRELRPYVRYWHQQALPFIATKPFEETYIDFMKAWPKVKFPKGSEPMSTILARARAAEPPKEATLFEREEARLLVAICREFQRFHGESPFFLSCRMAGELVEVPFKMTNRWLFFLVEVGVLELVKKGHMKGQRASRYRYLGEL